jgi:hypothetical protein
MQRRQSVSYDAAFKAQGVHYAFCCPEVLCDLDGWATTALTLVCELSQPDFACPVCSGLHTIIGYFFSAEVRIVQALWCDCAHGKPVPFDGEPPSGAHIFRYDRHGSTEACLAAERRLIGSDCCVVALRWQAGEVQASGPCPVSGVQIQDAGSATHCWRCALGADASDWRQVENESHDFALASGGRAEWHISCHDCKSSWIRDEPDAAWRPMSYDLEEDDCEW